MPTQPEVGLQDPVLLSSPVGDVIYSDHNDTTRAIAIGPIKFVDPPDGVI
jgi:hypothetical protein